MWHMLVTAWGASSGIAHANGSYMLDVQPVRGDNVTSWPRHNHTEMTSHQLIGNRVNFFGNDMNGENRGH